MSDTISDEEVTQLLALLAARDTGFVLAATEMVPRLCAALADARRRGEEAEAELTSTRNAALWLATNEPGTPVPEWVDRAVNATAANTIFAALARASQPAEQQPLLGLAKLADEIRALYCLSSNPYVQEGHAMGLRDAAEFLARASQPGAEGQGEGEVSNV